MAEQIPQQLLEEVPPENLRRITDSRGTAIPYGYLFEYRSSTQDGRLREIPLVSGYILGAFYSTENFVAPWWGVLFEIPNRYSRQVLLLVIPNQTSSYSNSYEYPISGRLEADMDIDSFLGRVVPEDEVWSWTHALDWQPRVFNRIGPALAEPEARGRQIFIGLDFTSGINMSEEWQEGDRSLLESLRNNEGYGGPAHAIADVQFIITPAGLIPNH
jgi:hypothetical protein